jgi:hypothetical protein
VAKKARSETGVTPTLDDVVRVWKSCGAEISGGRRDRRYCSPEEQLALALAEPRLVGLIVQAAQTYWRAAAWLLERKYESWQLGAQPALEPPVREHDPFAEIDQLAARRRQREGVRSTT